MTAMTRTNLDWARGPECEKCGHDRYKVELDWTNQTIIEVVCGECDAVYKNGKLVEEPD